MKTTQILIITIVVAVLAGMLGCIDGNINEAQFHATQQRQASAAARSAARGVIQARDDAFHAISAQFKKAEAVTQESMEAAVSLQIRVLAQEPERNTQIIAGETRALVSAVLAQRQVADRGPDAQLYWLGAVFNIAQNRFNRAAEQNLDAVKSEVIDLSASHTYIPGFGGKR